MQRPHWGCPSRGGQRSAFDPMAAADEPAATAPAAAEDAAAAWSLEERAARRDAAAAAADADASPLAEVSVVTAVGTLRVDNAALYMPVERGEQVTSANLAIAAARADLEAADPAVVVDVGFEERDGYVSGGALAGDPALGQLWYGTRPLSEANEAAVVDVMLVYGSGAAFAIEGGYTTVRLPSAVEDLYKATLYLGVKRGGEGRRWAEGRATRGAAPIKGEDGGDAGEEDEALLEQTLTPEQVARLEARRAEKLREAERQQQREDDAREDARRSKQLQERLAELRREKALLAEENARLSAEVAAVMDAPDADDKERLDPREAERRYADALSAILDAKRKAAQQKERSDRVAFELQARLDEKEFKAKKIADSFKAFKREIFLAAEHSRTGKKLSKKVIDEFEAQEALRDQELEKVRLKNINLRNALKKCEAKLRAKEQLAEGLHLIDFEQLKIENQALAEKIEDRKDEIEKLRKKHAANVRVATHARETLAFEEKLCEKRRGELKALDAKLAVERDRVAKLKKRREKKRMRDASRSESKGFAANDMLVLDYEKRKVEITQTEARIQELKERYALLEADVAKNNALIAARTVGE